MTQSSKMKVMKEQYYLNGESLPTIPVPHDCIIKKVRLKNQCIEFVFEDDISNYDSIKHYKPDAKSLIIRYHFADDPNDYSIYRWIKPNRLLAKLFSAGGRYKRMKNCFLTELPEDNYRLEYLYHNVGYCSIITKLFSNGYIILDADIDYVEFEWIC